MAKETRTPIELGSRSELQKGYQDLIDECKAFLSGLPKNKKIGVTVREINSLITGLELMKDLEASSAEKLKQAKILFNRLKNVANIKAGGVAVE